jgi:hypothetical protein
MCQLCEFFRAVNYVEIAVECKVDFAFEYGLVSGVDPDLIAVIAGACALKLSIVIVVAQAEAALQGKGQHSEYEEFRPLFILFHRGFHVLCSKPQGFPSAFFCRQQQEGFAPCPLFIP